MKLGEIAVVVLPIVAGLLLSILMTWTSRPARVTSRWLAVLVTIAVGGCITVALAMQKFSDSPAAGSPQVSVSAALPPTGPPDGSLLQIAPDLSSRLVLSTDNSSGSCVLFSSHMDGSNRQRLADICGATVPVPGSTDMITQWSETPAHGGLEVRTVTGDAVRRLTNPPAEYEDESPALASRTGMVYFIRTHMHAVGDRTWIPIGNTVMRVPLDGSRPEEPVGSAAGLGTISTDDTGSVLAGRCQDKANVGQACRVMTGSVGLHPIPGSEGTTMSDIQVSPDGRFIAYSSFRANPYGESQVFLYDIGTGQTVDLSQLAGLNSQPSWAHGAARPCLLFTHDLTGYDPSIYLGCLTPQPRTLSVLSIGQYPQWLEP
jgi:hypothetical protein